MRLVSLSLTLLLVSCGCVSGQGTGQITTPEAAGRTVVDAVIQHLQDVDLETNATKLEFLRRIACVESNNGTHPHTFRRGYHGGIWQVDKIALLETQKNPRLAMKRQRIRAELGIDWMMVPWMDLRRPLYSGLAAWLYVCARCGPIPDNLQGQAELWKECYNTACGAGAVQDFIERVRDCK